VVEEGLGLGVALGRGKHLLWWGTQRKTHEVRLRAALRGLKVPLGRGKHLRARQGRQVRWAEAWKLGDAMAAVRLKQRSREARKGTQSRRGASAPPSAAGWPIP